MFWELQQLLVPTDGRTWYKPQPWRAARHLSKRSLPPEDNSPLALNRVTEVYPPFLGNKPIYFDRSL